MLESVGHGASIPHFATGGIVNGPTLALVGEAGPEAIIPLSAFSGGRRLPGRLGGRRRHHVVNVTGNTISSQLDVRNLAQQVGDEIVRVAAPEPEALDLDMALTVTLAGTDLTSQIDQDKFQVQQVIGTQKNTTTLFYKKFGSHAATCPRCSTRC